MTKSHLIKSFRLAGTLLLGLISSHIHAQEEEKDPVFELNPFLVETDQDIGYQATNSVSGTRVNVPIKDIPITMDVVTKAFLDDFQVDDLNQALSFTKGIISSGNQSFIGGFTIRGFATEYYNYNGVRRYRNAPFEAIDRVEVVKGPAALIVYGIVEPGGAINIISKKPLTYAFKEIEASYSSYGNYKVTADINQPLNKSKTINFRINGSFTEGDNYFDLEEMRNWTVVPTISFSLWKNRIKWNLEWEKTHLKRDHAAHGSLAGSWGETGIGEATLTPANPSRNFGGMVGLHPRSFPEMNVDGPDGFVDQKADIRTSDLSIKLTDWMTVRQVNNWMDDDQARQFAEQVDWPRFSANTFRSVPGDAAFNIINGSSSKDSRARGLTHMQSRLRNNEQTHQSEILFEFSTGSIDHRILAGYEYKGVEFTILRSDPADSNLYTYDIATGMYSGQATQEFGEKTVQTFSDTENDAFYTNWQLSLWDGRIKTLAGVRSDKGGEVGGIKYKVTNPSVGLVYQPNESWSMFAGYSESAKPFIQRERRNDPESPYLPRETGSGMEVGIRFNLFEDRVIGNLMAFDLTKENIPTELTPGFFISSGEQRSKGIEFDVMTKPMEDLQIIFNLAYLDSEVVRNENYPLLEGTPMHNTPKWQWNVAFNKSFLDGPLKGIKLIGGLKYVGGGRHQWSPANGIFGESFILGSYTVVDVGIQYKWTRNDIDYQFSLNAKNLLDEFYVVNQLYAGAPMEIVAAFKVRF